MPTRQTTKASTANEPTRFRHSRERAVEAHETRECSNAHTVLKLSQTHKGAQKDIAGGQWKAPSFPLHSKGQDFEERFAVDLDLKVSMILPQVHLRKPCYDFSFL